MEWYNFRNYLYQHDNLERSIELEVEDLLDERSWLRPDHYRTRPLETYQCPNDHCSLRRFFMKCPECKMPPPLVGHIQNLQDGTQLRSISRHDIMDRPKVFVLTDPSTLQPQPLGRHPRIPLRSVCYKVEKDATIELLDEDNNRTSFPKPLNLNYKYLSTRDEGGLLRWGTEPPSPDLTLQYSSTYYLDYTRKQRMIITTLRAYGIG